MWAISVRLIIPHAAKRKRHMHDNGSGLLDEKEPKVLTADLQAVLRRVVQVDQEGDGPSVATIAEKASTSTRTVYRAIAGTTPHTSLDLADRLCIACGVHLSECRLVWPDGSITGYFDR